MSTPTAQEDAQQLRIYATRLRTLGYNEAAPQNIEAIAERILSREQEALSERTHWSKLCHEVREKLAKLEQERQDLLEALKLLKDRWDGGTASKKDWKIIDAAIAKAEQK